MSTATGPPCGMKRLRSPSSTRQEKRLSAGTEPRGLAERVRASHGSAIQCVRLHSSRGGSGGAQASTPGSSGECISALPPQALRSATSAGRSADKSTLQKPTQKRPPLYLVLHLVSQRKHALILKERSAPIPRRGSAPVPGRAPHSVRMSKVA